MIAANFQNLQRSGFLVVLCMGVFLYACSEPEPFNRVKIESTLLQPTEVGVNYKAEGRPGRSNRIGPNRFVVYHDISRNPSEFGLAKLDLVHTIFQISSEFHAARLYSVLVELMSQSDDWPNWMPQDVGRRATAKAVRCILLKPQGFERCEFVGRYGLYITQFEAVIVPGGYSRQDLIDHIRLIDAKMYSAFVEVKNHY
jgi:hypothetical protein